MSTLGTHASLVVAILLIALIAALAGWLIHHQYQSRRLRRRFGPEYRRTLSELGSRSKAESELMAREKRVESFAIVPLAPADAARFSSAWKAVQGRFVDDPRGAVSEADRLVRELMQARGYPMGDFERLSADISVHHPRVVQPYRAAQEIAVRSEQGQAGTEELRKAVTYYRALFAELLDESEAHRDEEKPHRKFGFHRNNGHLRAQ